MWEKQMNKSHYEHSVTLQIMLIYIDFLIMLIETKFQWHFTKPTAFAVG